MFLQLAILAFAVQWFGSPWQLGLGRAILTSLFFILIVIISSLPAMFREWGNIKSALKVYIIIQIICLTLSVLIPGIGQIFAIIFNVFLFFRPVSFYKNIGFGFILFFAWFIGLNNILANFILTDPRGVLSGDLFLTVTDWVILAVFIAALARTIYHIIINYRLGFLQTANSQETDKQPSDLLEIQNPIGIIEDTLKKDTQTINQTLQKKERKTLFPLFLSSLVLIIVSTFITPSWQKQAIMDLNKGFLAVSQNDFYTAGIIANNYYNDKRILYNGDVFFLNGLINETDNPQEALQFFIRAADWYDSHKSWISDDHHGESNYRLALMYLNNNPPDYYRARLSIEKAIKINPDNLRYQILHTQILEHITRFEEQERTGFFRRFWNRLRARF
jgi:tetratricopeptide (TPR) repeat protein